MATMGRPPIPIDWDNFDKLCQMQCTLVEIASFFNCSTDTIENKVKSAHGVTFSAYLTEKAAIGRISLRRKMYKMALEGDRVMLIWLSKQYMGMAEKQEVKQTAEEQKLIIQFPEDNEAKAQDQP